MADVTKGTSFTPLTTQDKADVRASLGLGSAAVAAVTDFTAAVKPTTFAQALDFSNPGQMATQTVSAPITFTVGALSGRSESIAVDLIADGVSAVNVTGMRETDGSSGYRQIVGLRNLFNFQERDGIVYYAINQRLSLEAEPGFPLAQVVRFNNLFNMTEGGSALTGWQYTATNAGFFQNTARAARYMPANASTPVTVQHQIVSVALGDCAIGLATDAASAANYGLVEYGIWVPADGHAAGMRNNSFPSVTAAGYFIDGDIVRLTRDGTTLTAYRVRGTVATQITQWTGVPANVALYIGILLSGLGNVSANIRGTNLV